VTRRREGLTEPEVGKSPCGLELHAYVGVGDEVHELFDVRLADLQVIRLRAQSERDEWLQHAWVH
jgi:hypothetical protein